MGKILPIKHFITSIMTVATLLGGVSSPTLAYAESVSEDGTIWWSVSEILSREAEFEAELEDACGDDDFCKTERRNDELYSAEPTKYSILMNMKSQRFIITDVNPITESIKILFFDVNPRTNIEDPMKSLYIAWFDKWSGQIYEYDHASFTDGSRPDTHMMYDYASGDEAPEPNREFEISVAGSNLGDNTTSKLGYHITTDKGFFAYGPADYSTCSAGADCALYVSQNGEQRYFSTDVFNDGTDDNSDIVNSDETGASEPAINPDSPNPVSDEPDPNANPGVEPDQSGASASDSIIPAVSNRSATVPLSPDTGKSVLPQDSAELGAPKLADQEAHEFPWWIVAAMFSSVVAVIGYLALSAEKRSKTSSKHAT